MTERWIDDTLHPDWRVAIKADEVLHEAKAAATLS